MLEFCLIFGVSLALSALNVFYRDFNQIGDMTLQLGFFATPILYGPELVPEKFQGLYHLNPMVWITTLFRKILFYDVAPTFQEFAAIIAAAGLAFVAGYIVFRRYEPRFADQV